MQKLVLVLFVCLTGVGCASTTVNRTRALIEAGDLDRAVTTAGSSWPALREVSLAIVTSALAQAETRSSAVRALEAAGDPATPALIGLVGSDDPLESALGAAALLRLGEGEEALLRSLLVDRLGSSDPETRAVAVRAVGPIVGDESFFSTHLSDPDESVRLAAVAALAEARDVETQRELLEARARDDGSAVVRARSLEALCHIDHGPTCLELATAALSASELVLRLAAVDAISHVDDRGAATSQLQAVMRDDEGAAKVRAAVALARWGDPAAMAILSSTLVDGEASLATTAAIGSGQVGEPMVDALVVALGRDEEDVRLNAAASLFSTEARDQAEAVLERLLDSPSWIGLQAALVLARSGHPGARARVAAALSDPDAMLRAYATGSCALIPDGLDLARRNLADRDPAVRLAAASTVLRIMAREG